jgi:DNA-binding NarL/FixJ family response regulator
LDASDRSASLLKEFVRSVLALTDSSLLALGIEVFAREALFEFAGSCQDLSSCAETVERSRPDLIVLDDELEGATTVCGEVASRWPDTPVLVLSTTLEDASVHAAIDAGARGYVQRKNEREVLRFAFDSLAQGSAFIDPRLRDGLAAREKEGSAESEDLSGRELTVLRHVARGTPNKRIAMRMGISESTVKTYLRRVYRKLDCNTRFAAVVEAERRGLLPRARTRKRPTA